ADQQLHGAGPRRRDRLGQQQVRRRSGTARQARRGDGRCVLSLLPPGVRRRRPRGRSAAASRRAGRAAVRPCRYRALFRNRLAAIVSGRTLYQRHQAARHIYGIVAVRDRRTAPRGLKGFSMPLVSIITPSWNVAPLIGETIASVQAQTMTDWELLIADDCSTDQTAAIVESHAAQ